MWRFSCHSSGVSVNSFSVSSIFFFVRSIFLLSKYGEPTIVNKLNKDNRIVKSKDHLTQLCFQKITYNIMEIVVLIVHKTNFFFLYAGSKIVFVVAWSSSFFKTFTKCFVVFHFCQLIVCQISVPGFFPVIISNNENK